MYYMCINIYIYIYIHYIYIYIYIYNHALKVHCSFLIRRQRARPGVVLPLAISDSAKPLGRNAIGIEPN